MEKSNHTAYATADGCQQQEAEGHIIVSSADSGANIEGALESTAAHAIGSGPQSADNTPAEISAELVDGTLPSTKNADAEYKDSESGEVDLVMSLPESGPRFLIDRCEPSDRKNNDEVSGIEKTASDVGPDSGANGMAFDRLVGSMAMTDPGDGNEIHATEIPQKYELSFFTGFNDKEPISLPVKEFIDLVQSDKWKDIISDLREIRSRSESEYKKEKGRLLPFVTPSGRFEGGRKASQLVEHSGIFPLDFDADENPILVRHAEEIRDRVAKDPSVIAVFVSPSGDGIAVFCRIDPDQHNLSFLSLCDHFRVNYELIHDRDCTGEVCRARFVSHDPGAIYNPDAVVFDRYVEHEVDIPRKERKSLPEDLMLTLERAREIESALAVLSPDDYDAWVKVGMAVHSECPGMAGFNLWQKWSLLNDSASKYDEGDSIRTWQSFGKREGVTLGTLFKMAQDAGWRREPKQGAAAEDAGNHGGLVIVSADSLISSDPPPVDPVVENLFDAGDKVCVVAPSKSRKTWFLIQLALATASGTRFLNWRIPQSRRVLLIQLEVAAAHFQRRLKVVHRGLQNPNIGDRLGIVNGRGQNVTPSLIAKAALKFRAEVIFIDPVYKLQAGDENSARDWRPLLAAFDDVAERTGAAVVFVHHDSKGVSGDRLIQDRGAGSGILARDYDCAIAITSHQKGGELKVVETIKRNYPPEPTSSVLWDNGVFSLSDEAPVVMTSRSSNKNPTTDKPVEGFLEHVVECLGKAESGVLNKGRLLAAIKESAGLTNERSACLLELALEQDVIVTNHGLGLTRKQVLYALDQTRLDAEMERLNAITSGKQQ